jgi:hypothetical protein
MELQAINPPQKTPLRPVFDPAARADVERCLCYLPTPIHVRSSRPTYSGKDTAAGPTARAE